MKFQCEGTEISAIYGDDKQKLTVQEAVRLQSELSSAIEQALEEKNRKVSQLLVTPGDAAWGATLAGVDL